MAVQEWQLAAIDEGIKAADAGRVAAHEEVAAWVKSWGSPDELPMPKCGFTDRLLKCGVGSPTPVFLLGAPDKDLFNT